MKVEYIPSKNIVVIKADDEVSIAEAIRGFSQVMVWAINIKYFIDFLNETREMEQAGELTERISCSARLIKNMFQYDDG